jgi:hypothetical protein
MVKSSLAFINTKFAQIIHKKQIQIWYFRLDQINFTVSKSYHHGKK